MNLGALLSISLLLMGIILAGCVETRDDAYTAPGPAVPPASEQNATPYEAAGINQTSEGADAQPPEMDPFVESVLQSYNESDPASFSNVNKLLDEPPSKMLPLLQSRDGYAVWTALYILSNTAGNAAGDEREAVAVALKPFLNSTKSGYRLMASVALANMGDPDAIPVLIGLLSCDEPLFLSEPPVLACTASNEFLMRYSRQNFGYSCSPGNIDEESRLKWVRWAEDNQEHMGEMLPGGAQG